MQYDYLHKYSQTMKVSKAIFYLLYINTYKIYMCKSLTLKYARTIIIRTHVDSRISAEVARLVSRLIARREVES